MEFSKVAYIKFLNNFGGKFGRFWHGKHSPKEQSSEPGTQAEGSSTAETGKKEPDTSSASVEKPKDPESVGGKGCYFVCKTLVKVNGSSEEETKEKVNKCKSFLKSWTSTSS